MAWSWMSVGRSKGAASAAAELLSIAQLQRVLARERARADRNGHHFSIVIFDIQPANGDSAVQHWRLADLLFSRLRCTDDVGWFDEGRLAAVLPDTPLDDAWKVAGDIRHLADGRIPHLACAAYTYPPAWWDHTKKKTEGRRQKTGETRSHLPRHGDTQRPDTDERPNGAQPDDRNRSVAPLGHHMAQGHSRGAGARGQGPGLRIPGAAPENRPLSPPSPVPSTAHLELRTLLSAPRTPHPAPSTRHAAPGTPHPADELQQCFGIALPLWKRLVDIVGAAIGLVLFAPLMVLTAVLVKATSPGPAIFTQARIGKDGAAFPLYKFRTMSVDADERKATLLALNEQTFPVFKMKSDPRVTPLGRLLRTSSLDELPQLWNVLKGDMSLVGPRPPTVDEVQAYERWHHRRLALTPGLTCIWQVSGRSLIDFPNWVRMDIEYAERRSLWLDLQILARTIPAVLSGRGAH